MQFDSGQKKQLVAGSHRICTPEETLFRIEPIKHEFGITRVANVTGLDKVGVPVAIAIRPNARSIAISQGKGATYAHAKASALMEAIEIWHAEHFEREVFFASFADLSQQHQILNLDRLPRTRAPVFNAAKRMHWVKAVELISDAQVLVPLEMVHADYTHPVSHEAGYFPASTNGLASGNHLLEAICHAICEVIERDALSVWNHLPVNTQRSTRLDPTSLADVTLLTTLEKFTKAGLSYALWDITSDVGVASIMCVLHEKSSLDGHMGLGSGTHLDPKTAVQRAVNEAAQTRLNYISGAREDLFHEEFSAEGRRQKVEAFAEVLEDQEDMRRFEDLPSTINTSLLDDLKCLKESLRKVGVAEIAMVDLSRKEFGIPVVRVIIPGLEAPHDDSDYVMGPRAKRARDGASPR